MFTEIKKNQALLAVALLTVFTVFPVNGQGTTTRKKEATTPSSSATKRKARARRPVVGAKTTPATSPAQATAEPAASKTAPVQKPSAEPAKPVEASTGAGVKPATKPSETPASASAEAAPSPATEPKTPPDPIATLRDDIEAAGTAQERIVLQLQLVDELLATGKRPEAIAELHKIVDADAFDPKGFYNTANALARLGETDEAIKSYRKAIDQRKGNYSRAQNNLGVVLLRAGRWEEAYLALVDALKVENYHYPEASYNLGRLYAARGETDLAVREWRRVLAQDPNHAGARDALARAGREGRVEVENKKVPPPPRAGEQKPNITTPRTSNTPVKLSAASNRSSKPLAVDQTSYDFLQRARNSYERGNALDAVDNYKRVIARQGGYFPPANLELSYVQVNLKRYDEALENLQLVSNRDGSRFPISYFHLARLYEIRGELKLAEAAFSQVVAAYGPANNQFLLDLSRVREKQGNFKGALEAMEQYVNAMKQQGETISWSDERLGALRQKLSTPR